MREISLHLLDIIQNSITANASTVEIRVVFDKEDDLLTVSVFDNGKGMSKEFLEVVADPFVTSRTTRKVGLGISLFKLSAEQTGGTLKVSSTLGEFTEITASFKLSSINRLPLGKLSTTVAMVIYSNPSMRIKLQLSSNSGTFKFDTAEIINQLQGLPINEYAIINWIESYIEQNIINIFGGILDEVNS